MPRRCSRADEVQAQRRNFESVGRLLIDGDHAVAYCRWQNLSDEPFKTRTRGGHSFPLLVHSHPPGTATYPSSGDWQAYAYGRSPWGPLAMTPTPHELFVFRQNRDLLPVVIVEEVKRMRTYGPLGGGGGGGLITPCPSSDTSSSGGS